MSEKTELTEVAAEGALQTAPVELSQSAQVMQMIMEAAKNPEIDVAKMQVMMDMSFKLQDRQAEQEFNQAMARLAGKLPFINKDGQVEYDVDKNNPSKGKIKAFKFATFENIYRAVRPFLVEEGFTLSWDSQPRQGDGGGQIVIGTLSHISGHSRKATWQGPLDTSGGKNNLQAGGSTTSYGMRNTMRMLLNIVTEGEDDDGKLGGTEFITEEEVKLINKMIAENAVKEDAFLEFMQAARVENIVKKDLVKAINSLNAKAKKNAAKPEAPPPATE